jgi:nitronate monooxygenase
VNDLAPAGNATIRRPSRRRRADSVNSHARQASTSVVLTRAFTGLQTNMLRPSIVAAGLDPDALPKRGGIDIAKDIDVAAREQRPKRWRDIWSAGHSTSGVTKVMPVAELVDQTAAEYRAARPNAVFVFDAKAR